MTHKQTLLNRIAGRLLVAMLPLMYWAELRLLKQARRMREGIDHAEWIKKDQ